MLKPIPQEKPDPYHLARHIARSVRQTIAVKKRFMMAPKIHQKMDHEYHKEKKFLQSVNLKMIKFLSKAKKHSHREMSDMIMELQKSIICLQRQKHKMIWLEQKKKKTSR